jgi:YD repeat-containing protein
MNKLASVVTHRDRDGGGTEDQPTIFSYDAMGRPTNVHFPDGSNEVSTYQFGQLKTWQTRKGQTKTIGYDARGRESSHTWNDGQTPGINRTWDPASRLTMIQNSAAAINYGYDDAGQVEWENEYVTGADTAVQTNYVRYGNGAIWRVQYPNGLLSARAYTARGQLKTVWENSPGWWRVAIDYNYYPDGKVEHQDYGNGMRTGFDYDDRGFTRIVNHYYNPAGWQNYSWRYYWRDERDRIVAWQKSTANGSNPMENGRGNHYYYDAEGELTDGYYGAADPLEQPEQLAAGRPFQLRRAREPEELGSPGQPRLDELHPEGQWPEPVSGVVALLDHQLR